MNSPLIGRVTIVCAACFGILLFAREAGPRTAPPPRPSEVRSRALLSRPDRIEIAVDLPEPQVISGATAGSRIELPGATAATTDGDAELPLIRQFIAIPECDRVELQVEASDVQTSHGVSVRRATDSGLLAHPGVTPAFPAEWARVVSVQHARGQALALVELRPVRYDRGKGEISYPREIRLQLKPVNPRGPVAVNAGPLQSALSAVVPNLKNFDGGSSPTGPSQRTMNADGQVCWCDTDNDDWAAAADYVNTYCAADYLMIVADELLTETADSGFVEQLATKRAQFNGFNVAIVRMGQIDSTPDNTTTPGLMRSLVESIYDLETAGHMGDNHLGYVLLLGDAVNPNGDVILPTHYHNVYDYKDDNLNGSDAYFVLLDGIFDTVPDLLIGRLTVDTDATHWELENVVTKITEYEPITASASWSNEILLMSGGSDLAFTFYGDSLSGFENYFDSIEALAPPGSVTFTEMHRLAGAGDSAFSQDVCDEIANGYAVVGLFDHANPVNFENAFFPLHYDTLRNFDTPSLVLSFGSHSGYFDYLGCTSGCCYPSPTYPGLPCRVPPTPLDSLDCIAERLLVQPAGAMGVVAYGRSHQAVIVQRVFANAFRALFQHRQGRLGDLVLATKLLSADDVTTSALNLLGDPALSIQYQFDSVAEDSVDLAVSGLDIAFPSALHDYGASSSSQSIRVVVTNEWKADAASVPVEVWAGEPDSTGSSLLSSFTVSSLPAYSDTTWTGSIGSFSSGDYDIYVIIDPDDTLNDPVPANNVSYRTLHLRDYLAGFPVECFASRVELLDAALGSPRELEIAAGSNLYGADGLVLGAAASGPVGNLFRSNKRHFVRDEPQVAGYQPVAILEAGGTWADYWYFPGDASDMIVLDHGLPDSMLIAFNVTQGSDRRIDLYTAAGSHKWSHTIGTLAGGTVQLKSAAMAAGDITGDGVSDVVYAMVPILASGDSLGVLDGKTGSRVWTIATSDEVFDPVHVRLVDVDDDGVLEVLVNTRVAGSPDEDRIQCYGTTGTLLWEVSVGDVNTISTPPPLFAPVDVDRDGVKEVMFAHDQRFGIITVSGGSGSVTSYTDLSGYHVFDSTPLAADIDGDGALEFNVFSLLQDHYFNEYSLELRLYDDDLSAIGSVLEFPWVQALGAGNQPPLSPAVGDIDGDGIFEVVFATPDGSLHAVRVGSSAGRDGWMSVDGDPQRTSLFEQVLGGEYSEHVAISGRTRVLSDVTFGEGVTITTPADVHVGPLDSLVVEGTFAVLGNEDDSVRVGIDELSSPGSFWGGFLYDNASIRGNIQYAVLSEALVGFDHASPLKIIGTRITAVSGTGIVSADSLWLLDSEVGDAGGNGVELGLGAVASIERSLIQNVDGNGLVCDSCAATSRVVDSTIRDAGVHGAFLQRVHGFLVDSSVCEDNESAGLRFESADGSVDRSRTEGNAVGIVCLDHSSPVITENRIDLNSVGVAGADDSYPVVGFGSIGGNNCVTNSTGYQVSNLSAGTIYVRHDYLGSICCQAKKLFGNVDCDSCEASSVCDGSAAIAAIGLAEAPTRSLPTKLALVGAAPNPFNPSVRIRFAVPVGGARVQLVVYNVRGQRVAILENGMVPAGYHERQWDGVDERGRPVASGVYFVQMRSSGFQQAMKIVLLK